MTWQQLTLPCTAQDAENLGDFLFELGASSVSFEDAQDNPIFEPTPGTMPLWEQTLVIGLFAQETDLTGVFAALQQQYPKEFALHQLKQIADQVWETAYLQYFQPIAITDNLWICPSWLEPPQPDAINILLDPGVAFGTGTHPTTQLCLRALARLNLHDKTVIDYGCGSGILAIAAAKLGARKVIAVDIHEQALDATVYNAEQNAVADKIEVYSPEKLRTNSVDVLVANILAEPLVSLADKFISLLNHPGYLILSGILIEQTATITAAYAKLNLIGQEQSQEWTCLQYATTEGKHVKHQISD